MDILTDLVPRLPALGAIIFELGADYIGAIGLGPIGELLGRLNQVWATRRPAAQPPRPVPPGGAVDGLTAAIWESALGAGMTGDAAPALPAGLADWFAESREQIGLYRTLAGETRASSLVEAAPRTVRTLLRQLREATTRDLLGQFWQQSPPAYTIVEDAWMFLDFVSARGLGLAGLEADIASDRARLCEMVGAPAFTSPSRSP
jgi:hypothetical protein